MNRFIADAGPDQQVATLQQAVERLSELVGQLSRAKPNPQPHHHGMDCEGCREQVNLVLCENPDDQPERHEHGDGCDECVRLQRLGEYQGIQRTARFYEEKVPGAKEAREHAWVGEQVITIVDHRPDTINTRTLSDFHFKLILYGLMKKAEERPNDPDLKALLAGMMEEAGQRGIR